ncbi:MAG TPA: ATPase, T2SS/T4P/T4SS family [Pyrinomonadaceae bacterium]|nr:ATPase, T2SS/T4P/T4SS family [Pyrinomonadaceae bacterium]
MNSLEDLIFYVNEKESDEFTFYLDQKRDKAVIAELRSRLGPSRNVGSGNTLTKEIFSFPQRIRIKNLTITKDTLLLSNYFWSRLKNAKADTPCGYLCARLKKKKKTSHCFGKQRFDEEDKKLLQDEILKILNRAVSQDNLSNKKWRIKALQGREKDFLGSLHESDAKNKWRNRFIVDRAFWSFIKPTQVGRALICFSYVGQYLSVTFRKISEEHGYIARDYQDQSKRKSNLFSLSEYCDVLYREIFKETESTEHAQGLVVITGSTKSAKSEIARGLIQLYLDGKEESNRRHHLVTFEDPVERFYSYENVEGYSPWVAVDLSKSTGSRDYTPRQKETDSRLLQEALIDALRQTPALFFVGETRDREEWKVLLDFAATGHLIVTTAHAGSLVEAMHKIFEALKVNTAADRSEIASKLLGVIHLRRHELEFADEDNETHTNSLFPALWRRTPRGIAALTSDGLASLLPYRPKKRVDVIGAVSGSLTTPAKKNNRRKNTNNSSSADAASCLGRRWIVEELLTKTTGQVATAFGDVRAADLIKQAYAKATEWDLQGV